MVTLKAVPAVCGLLIVPKTKLDMLLALTVNELLVPVAEPSVAVIVTLVPAAVTVTKPVQTPEVKPPVVLVGVIVPSE